MPRCQMQAVQGISVKDIKSSVISYVCSVRYMKKVVPLTVYNIIYNRVDFDENLFVNKSVCNIGFKTFKSGTKNHVLADVFYWSKGAADAIEKKNLREMHLLFQDKSDDSIIENYKYAFTYDEEPNSAAKMPSSEDVIEATRQFFQSIQSLSEYKKMDKDVNILIELILSDENYDVPHFTCPEGIPFCVRALENSESTTIGRIQTGYHKLKCSVKGATFDIMNNSTVTEEVNAEELINDQEKDTNENNSKIIVIEDEDMSISLTDKHLDFDDDISVSSKMNDESEPLEPDIILDKSDFHCPCGINALIGTIKKIKCTICLKYQHLICTGCINLGSLIIPYICVYCNADDRKAFDENLLNFPPNKWKPFCVLRLVMNYCYTYEQAPVRLLQRVDDDIKNYVSNFIKRGKMITRDQKSGTEKFNKSAMVNVMSNIFIDFRLPSSMVLGDPLDTEMCE